MLSRAAERMYWFGRYIERAENLARLIDVNTSLIFDLPDASFIWQGLISVTGYEEEFASRFSKTEERNVIRFLLEDPQGSIRSAVRSARENARTSRELLPREAWQKVNDLSLYLKQHEKSGIKRAGRQEFISGIINRCHELTGYLAGSMSNDLPYNFIRIGRNLERADMTTRILDVGCFSLITTESTIIAEHENILWTNVLRSIAAFQMYRQHVKDVVNGEDVVDFLVNDPRFPRAVVHCLREVQECFTAIPRNEHPLLKITEAQRGIGGQDVTTLLKEGDLHAYIDDVQLSLAEIHDSVANTWFDYTGTSAAEESA